METKLLAGLEELGLDVGPQAREKMLAYLRLLSRWNRVYNLTAITGLEEMVAWHLLDSLAILPHLRGSAVVDAGTGAGLPGVPLALARSDWAFRLVDGNGKRIRFLRHVKRELEIANIEPEQGRLEALDTGQMPDEIVTRALAPLPRQVEWAAPLLDAGARLLAMKGDPEAQDIPGFDIEVAQLNVPGVHAARSLMIIQKSK